MFSTAFGDSGVVVDFCAHCKGVWLDRNEFQAINEFVGKKIDGVHQGLHDSKHELAPVQGHVEPSPNASRCGKAVEKLRHRVGRDQGIGMEEQEGVPSSFERAGVLLKGAPRGAEKHTIDPRRGDVARPVFAAAVDEDDLVPGPPHLL